MADILYEITGGFFDSVNQDRTYSAEQMNMPYKKIVTDGIFPDKNGGASEDFIVRPDEGMYVSVGIGNALVGGKWAELDSLTVLRVPSNTSAYSRIDSIILRADTSLSVRAVCIVYRQGTEAASPTAPALESSEYVTELRLADITVAAGVSTITAANITDQRGTEECPWVAGAIPPTQAQVSEAVDQYFEENPGIFVVDSAFSDSSTNAVQNKVVKAAVDQLTDDVAGLNGRLDNLDVDEAVQNWLDEHPEAVTTVQDGSLTKIKFSDALKAEAIKDYVTPQMYGYTEGADLGVYLQMAVDAIDGGVVFIPKGTYTMRTGVTLKSNITVMGDSSGETEIYHTTALLDTPLFTSDSSKQNEHIRLLNLSIHSSGARTAFTLLFSNVSYFWFKNCRIGTENGATSNFHGLRLQLVGSYNSTEAQICNNIIVGELDVWCSDAIIENNILWGYDRDAALLLRNGVHAMIRGNQFIGGANGSIYLLSTNTHSCDDASIIDNYFDGSSYSINGNWAIKALTKMVNCRIIGNNFWRQKKGAIYGNLQSCLIQNNCFVDNDVKNEGIPDIWLPMANDVFSNTISGNLFRRDSCFDTSGNWIARTVATKPYIFRFYNNANHAPTLVSGNVNGTQSAYDTIFVEGSASTAVLSDNVGMSATGGVLTETDFTSAYKTKVDSLWNDYQSAITALGI